MLPTIPAVTAGRQSGREAVAAILDGRRPDRIVYAPNYWQWFEHQRNRALPRELEHCHSQLDLIRHLGLDVFSRNIYSDQQTGWFGGLCDVVWSDVVHEEEQTRSGRDRLFHHTYRTKKGVLKERLRYVFDQSTLVQEEFLVNDPASQMDAFEALLRARRWRFSADRYRQWDARVAGDGYVVAGELSSPLKMLHLAMNPIQTCYFLVDEPQRAAELMALHETAMLDLVRQMTAAGVRVMMSMDNLDTQFHPPRLVEQCSASFYEHASRICHEHGSRLFIHACGDQRANLPLIAALDVDGLEGVAYPPLGDVQLEEAMTLSGDRLIITGGIAGLEFERLKSREAVFAHGKDLFRRMKPFAHRFILSASCSTPFTASWETLVHFRDVWQEYGQL